MPLLFARKGFESTHAIGVQPIHTTAELIKVVDAHRDDTGERFCPLFADMRAGLRVKRWVARNPNGRGFLIRLEENCPPEFVSDDEVMNTTFLGRYMREGRLFYDSLNLELPANLMAMQRLS